MKSTVVKPSANEVVINIVLDAADLKPILRHTYNDFRGRVKVSGFRPGRAPDHIVEREIGPQHIQEHVIEDAARKFYEQILRQEDLRPVGSPHVEVKKFVPFDSLELEFKADLLGPIKLADYKKFKHSSPKVEVSKSDVEGVVKNLQSRSAKRSEVKRTAKLGDELIIDMKGTRDGQEVPGTKAQDYGVLLGSDRFVPGFEKNLVGLKAGDKKKFDVTFPGDYPEPTLQDKKVTFDVTIKKVQELKLPEVDDKFAAEIGPFKTVSELEGDIKKQLEIEKEHQARRELTDKVAREVVDKSTVSVPKTLVQRQQEQLWAEFEQNVKNQGQDLDEYLKSTKKTRPDIDELLAKEAQQRVKTALVLSEVAEKEKIAVTPEELEIRLQILKGRYQDKQAQEELEKPEVKKDIADQLLIEKTVSKLVEFASK